MQHRDWIAKIILGPADYLVPNQRGSVTEEQQGFLYRLFAHHGGPLVLDALVGGIVPSQMPAQAADVPKWFDDALGQLIRSRATAAARVLEINRRNVMQLMKLALHGSRIGTASKPRLTKSSTEQQEELDSIIAAIKKGPLGQVSSERENAGNIPGGSAVGPHADSKRPVKASTTTAQPQPASRTTYAVPNSTLAWLLNPPVAASPIATPAKAV